MRMYPWHFNAWATAVGLAQRAGWGGVVIKSYFDIYSGRRTSALFQLGVTDDEIEDWITQVARGNSIRLPRTMREALRQ